jgi:hypothetical protein
VKGIAGGILFGGMSAAAEWGHSDSDSGDDAADGKAMDEEDIRADEMEVENGQWNVANPAGVPEGLRGFVLRCRLAAQAAERMGDELRHQRFRRPDLRECVCNRCVPSGGVVSLDAAGERVWFFDTEMKSKEPPDVTPTISEIAFVNAAATDVFHRFVFYKDLHESYAKVVKYVKEQMGGRLDLGISPWDSKTTSDLFPHVVWLMIARIPCQSLLISNGHDFDPVVLYENIQTRCSAATADFLLREIRAKQWKWISLEEITGNFYRGLYFGSDSPPVWLARDMFPTKKALFKQVDREFKPERYFIEAGRRLERLQARQQRAGDVVEMSRIRKVLAATESKELDDLVRDLKPLVKKYVQQFYLYRPPDGFEEMDRPVSTHLPSWSPVVIGKPRPVEPLLAAMNVSQGAGSSGPNRPEMTVPIARLQHLAHPLEGYSAQCGVNIAYHSATVDALCKLQVVAAIMLQLEFVADLDAATAKRVHAFFQRNAHEENDPDGHFLPAWMQRVFRDVVVEETRGLASGLLRLSDTAAMVLYAAYYKDAIVFPGDWQRGKVFRMLDDVEAEIRHRAQEAVARAAQQRPGTNAGASIPYRPRRRGRDETDTRLRLSVRRLRGREDDFSAYDDDDEKKGDIEDGSDDDDIGDVNADEEARQEQPPDLQDVEEKKEGNDNAALLQLMHNAPVQLEYMDYNGYAERIRNEAKTPEQVVAQYKAIFAERTARERGFMQSRDSSKNGLSKVAAHFINPLPENCDRLPYFIGAYGRGRVQDMDWMGAVRVHFVWCLHFYKTIQGRNGPRTDADDAVDVEESVVFQERTRIAYASNVDDHRSALPKVPRPNLRWLALLDAAKLSCSYVFCKNCKWYKGDGVRSINMVMQAWLPDLPLDNAPNMRKPEKSLKVKPSDLQAMDVEHEPHAPNLPYHYGRPVHPYEVDVLDEAIRTALQRKRIDQENLTVARLKPAAEEYSVGRWCVALLMHLA